MNRKILPVIVLLVLHAVLLWTSARQKSASVDEMSHLGAGMYSLSTLDFRINRSTSPLQNMLCALPVLLFEDYKLSFDNDCWRKGIWNGTGSRLFEANPDHFHDLLMTGRLSSMVLSVALCGLIFWWSFLCWGYGPAVGVLFLAALEPNFLAHGRLVTTDASTILFFLLTGFLAWRFSQKPGWGRLLAVGTGFGLACLSKHSGIMLLPGLFLGFWIVRFISNNEPYLFMVEWFKKKKRFYGSSIYAVSLLVIIMLFGFITIWAGYGFEVGDSIEGPIEPSRCKLWQISLIPIRITLNLMGLDELYPSDITDVNDPYLLLLRRWLPAYSHWEGFSFNYMLSKNGHWSYFMGESSNWGWVSYYPVLFLIKTPVPILIFLAIGAVALLSRRISLESSSIVHLLAIPLIYAIFIIFHNRTNIGYRHFLPVIPYCLILFAGAAFTVFIKMIDFIEKINHKKSIPLVFFVGLLAWNAIANYSIYPHYLEYFNELIGGPKNGNYYAVDSNLDWGQDLFFIKDYLEKKGINDAWLFYFGPEEYPGAYEVPHLKVKNLKTLEPGTYVISATHLRQFAGILRDPFLAPLKERLPDDFITPAIFVYKVE